MCVCGGGGGGGGDEVGSFCEVVNSFFGSSNSYNENHLWVIITCGL